MKKRVFAIILLVAVSASLVLAGCGSKGNGAGSGNAAAASAGKEQKEDFAFHYKDTEIRMNAPAEPVLAKLGEAMNYTEAASCAFEGLDKTYFYGSFYLTTYPKDDKDFISIVEIVDDTVQTDEGIAIGDPEKKVEETYGVENYNGINAYVVESGDSSLTIIIDGGLVSSIQYAALFD